MGYEFDWAPVLDWHVWASAISVTISYALATASAGLFFGVIIGLCLLSERAVIRWPFSVLVQFVRCTPLLVQIIWLYYVLPILTGLQIPATIAAGLGLTIYMSAFAAEIVRGGIISIEKGQWNASKAIGLTYLQMMRHVIMPQAVKRMIPPLVGQFILQMKNTSLLYVVAVPDLMYTSYELTARTYRPLEIYTFVALLYFAMLYPLTLLAKRLERRSDL
ncbi:amino acid ABC transporter permease [Agrobacterium tumefaciens]|nr:amino acid ABC transporter permease [Agrobacterium tumefaciens]